MSASGLAGFFETVTPHLDERQRRVLAGAMVEALGRGGQARVVEASKMSSSTVYKAAHEVRAGMAVSDRLRAPGGGAKQAIDIQPGLLAALDELVNPDTRGNPMSLLRWTLKSTYRLADDLVAQGFEVSAELVRRLLADKLGYSLQAPSKQKEGAGHADRDGQFRYLNDLAADFVDDDQPVISVDTKKKELIGEYKNGGRELQPKGKPEQVRVHDFIDREKGRVSPYGVYDLKQNEGWVSVGTDHDTGAFAVESIRRWWLKMGAARYPGATRLLITADGGGSNGYRLRLWKSELQKLADETGLEMAVCHFPPGTSKWNKIEHRLFAAISQNWRGKPLTSHEVVLNLIAATTTKTGLTVRSELDMSNYPTGRTVPDADMETLNLRTDPFHGEWNYSLLPRQRLLNT